MNRYGYTLEIRETQAYRELIARFRGYYNLELVTNDLIKAGVRRVGDQMRHNERIELQSAETYIDRDYAGYLIFHTPDAGTRRIADILEVSELSLIEEDQSFYLSPTGSDVSGVGSEANPWYSFSPFLEYLANKWVRNWSGWLVLQTE